MIGILMTAANPINVIIPYLQNVSAFSLKNFNKLFRFFQKPHPKQNATTATTQYP